MYQVNVAILEQIFQPLLARVYLVPVLYANPRNIWELV